MLQNRWFEVYGNYVERLEDDSECIFNYYGEDFLIPRKTKKRHCLGTVPGTVGGYSRITIQERETGFESYSARR